MKKSLLLILPCLLFFTINSHAQQGDLIDILGFQMERPKGWLELSKKEAIENLTSLELKDEKLKEYILKNGGMVLFSSLMKYDMRTHAGMIPAIRVQFRINPISDFEKFKMGIQASMVYLTKKFENYVATVPLTVIDIDGKKALYFVGEFDLTFQNQEKWKVRSRTYVIPHGEYYFQINFTGGQEEEQCTTTFERAIKSMKLTSN